MEFPITILTRVRTPQLMESGSLTVAAKLLRLTVLCRIGTAIETTHEIALTIPIPGNQERWRPRPERSDPGLWYIWDGLSLGLFNLSRSGYTDTRQHQANDFLEFIRWTRVPTPVLGHCRSQL